jgi:hypothetical protein
MKHFFTFLLLVVSTTVGAQSYCYEDKDGDGFGDPNTAVVRTIFGCPLLGGPWVDNGLQRWRRLLCRASGDAMFCPIFKQA